MQDKINKSHPDYAQYIEECRNLFKEYDKKMEFVETKKRKVFLFGMGKIRLQLLKKNKYSEHITIS